MLFAALEECVCDTLASLQMGKPSGIRAARQLKDRRRSQKWSDKKYNKVHLGSQFKSNPFGGSSHAKGIVVEKV